MTRRRTLRTPEDLAAAGRIAPTDIAGVAKVAARYQVALPPALAAAIDRADPADPLTRQFVPDPRELEGAADERADPIGDAAHSPRKGIVHRYPDRVLLTPLLSCPVYCRYCFRRARVGREKALTQEELARALDYVRSRPEVWEVILSGGDPLLLPPSRLKALIRALEEIPHVRVVRIHSRLPIAEPARVTAALVDALSSDKALWLAIHANHSREFTAAARAACRRLSAAGIPLLGQTVLLKGVNDDAAALEALLRTMVESRIKPYYLHHLDTAPGTAHFRTGIAAGQALMRALRGRLSGLCQPTYVLDIPGGHGKAPVGPSYLEGEAVTDWRGARHPLGGGQ